MNGQKAKRRKGFNFRKLRESKKGKQSWGPVVSKGCLEKSKLFRLMVAKMRALSQVVPAFGNVDKKISVG